MPSDPLILGFDTSAAHCAAALLCGDRVIADAHEDMTKGQAERLIPLLQEVLDQAGVAFGDLDRIGVGTGPGNFTGIRISVSAARGLALGLGIPAMGVSLLDAMAFGTDGPVLACLNATRGMAYVQGYNTPTEIPSQVIDPTEAPLDWAHPDLTCIGPAATLLADTLNAQTAPAAFAPAAAVARITAKRPVRANERPAPMYMRAADAAPAADPPPVILP